MKKLSFALLTVFAITIVTLSSCHMGCIRGSGNSAVNTRKPGNFKKIEIEGAFTVTLKQDSSRDVVVTADDNLQKYIHTVINDGALRIYRRKSFCNATPMTITIGVSDLQLLRVSGANDIKNDGTLNVKDLKLDFSGASKVTLNLNATNLVTEGSGSSEIHLKGQAATHKLDLTGSGHLFAYDFVTGDYDIHTTGASDVEINVLHAIKANTTGASDIKYKGNPSIIQNEKAGASEIKKVQ